MTPSDWVDAVGVAGPLVIRAVLVAAAAWIFARFARDSFERAASRTRADLGLRLLVGRAIYLAVLALGAIMVLDTLGLPYSTLVTVVGVVGIGISLALQDILKNFFAGTYLLFERPFRIGDEIQVKDQRGTVETIGVRTITLRTLDDVRVMVPNAMVFTEIVLNRTGRRRSDEPEGRASAMPSARQPGCAPPPEGEQPAAPARRDG